MSLVTTDFGGAVTESGFCDFSSRKYTSADSVASRGTLDVAGFFVVEDHDWNIVLHAVMYGLRVHHFQVLPQEVLIGNL